ncbi:hypothetical protein AWH63_06590 [Marinobacter sp. C18]|uniref:LamG-like jellyroll fold domain-containing protein n=1 Tax=Marinobacter sp. C18 TaxID=1772288 RepID=UPI0009489E9F|nr:LamG-like jellyroll fold domain-containing protein [Marinobacter sp. C18]OLF82667.1 hypothetical protein AWH63_06590 [Marinobacter sp. C18]
MAINLNGVDQWLRESFSKNSNAALTVAIKFKTDTLAVDQTPVGFFNDDSGIQNGFYPQYTTESPAGVRGVIHGSTYNQTGKVAISADTWHSVVLVNDGSSITLYLDDQPAETVSYSINTNTNDGMLIGARVNSGNDGVIDNFLSGKAAYYRRSGSAISAVDAAAYNSATNVSEINAVLPDGADLISNSNETGAASALTVNGSPTYDADDPLSSGPSVSSADDITSEGDTAEFTLSGNSAAPVSATLNGTSVGTLTLVSGSTYSYTAPLIADDGTADLVVSVDSTTASTVISYANSYPYELVTHGEPDANSAFFDTAFATNGPVEWGVVTDFDSGVVVVDWATMDAAEDELNDIALHSTEVAAGESTATLKYFVPESGATGTFQATATVDGTDETAPTISSASVPTAGNNIAVQMSESMQVGAGGSGGWTVSLAGVSVSSASVDGTDDTIINLTPSRTLTDEDTLTIGYTQPGDGFQDLAATPNDLATLSGQAVTNNSTQQPPDVTGPVTQSVGVPTAGTYAIGNDLSFTVNWDEAVTVTGIPALNLDIGGTSRQADYVSGSGSAALVFTYTVQAGDEDDSGIAVSSLTLEGGTLQDASSNNATLTLNSVGDTSGVLVDGVAPVISINALTTTDTTPVVTGSAGDATSLTLVVNSVTYNPTPSGGTWSQQLPELALDTYPMTLNGQDAAGNAAVEAQGTLSVVAELPVGVFALIGPAIEPAISNSLEDAIG